MEFSLSKKTYYLYCLRYSILPLITVILLFFDLFAFLVAAFISLVIFLYFNLYFRSYSIQIKENFLIIKRGVYFKREYIIPKEGVIFFSEIRTPLIAMLSLSMIRIFMTKRIFMIAPIRREAAKKIIQWAK